MDQGMCRGSGGLGTAHGVAPMLPRTDTATATSSVLPNNLSRADGREDADAEAHLAP